MGNLLQAIKKDARRIPNDVFLDFESAEPSDGERETYEQVRGVLARSQDLLSELESYQGAGELIRKAITNASDETAQDEAWKAVCPLVQKLKEFYEYSHEIEQIVPQILGNLCSESPEQSLIEKQALTKQLAEILHFVLQFDDLKMNNPAIQNDFSYYRRTLNRMKMNNDSEDVGVVSSEEANRMSLFYAYPTPMLKSLSDTTSKFVADNKDIPVEHTTDCLSMMANVCRTMLDQPDINERFSNQETVLFVQRVMVGLIILYDHVHHIGAFSKKNPSIDIRAAIRVLKSAEQQHQDAMMNALRYTTKHLNEADTPREVKKLLSA